LMRMMSAVPTKTRRPAAPSAPAKTL
jgi:hypothetical protein